MHENYHGCRTRNRSLSRMSVQVDCVRYYFFFFILFSHGSSFRLSFFPLYFFPFPLYQFFTFSSFFSFFYFFCLSFPFLHRPTAPLLYPFTHTHTHTHDRHIGDTQLTALLGSLKIGGPEVRHYASVYYLLTSPRTLLSVLANAM